MATKLKNMELNSVDLVKRGANQKADIRLFKSAETGESPQEGPTTEAEKNVFKRFLNWLYETTASDEAVAGLQEEPETPIEKGDIPETANTYKNAITESIQSIIADDSLSDVEKNDMVAKSLGQYHDKMMELAKAEPQTEAPAEQEEAPETEPATEKAPTPEYDYIQEI